MSKNRIQFTSADETSVTTTLDDQMLDIFNPQIDDSRNEELQKNTAILFSDWSSFFDKPKDRKFSHLPKPPC